MIVESLEVEPLFVPLKEPFVIATARMETTRTGLVRVRLRSERSGRAVLGLGEAAPLPPVTREDFDDVRRSIEAVAAAWVGRELRTLPDLPSDALADPLADALADAPVARAALATALLDAACRVGGVSAAHLLATRRPEIGRPVARRLETDVTLPIVGAARMAELAREWRALGFTQFKVKVGKDLDEDVRSLLGVHAAVRDARFRLDANEGFTAQQALALLRAIESRGLVVECFEQPCARDDLEGMARVTRDAKTDVIADESVRTMADLEGVLAAEAADGVNLKLAKHGGPLAALEIGVRAMQAGMSVMCGAMVETRLGLVAMGHVAAALGGVDFVDLDTAFLLAADPFEGGWTANGPILELTGGPGLDVRMA
ncbi:MAG: hypothetical protein HYV09_08595 [Deltaproteobacteria bacterium]|nr:hypothetical protein [Deltaproteobacteria bacterium]